MTLPVTPFIEFLATHILVQGHNFAWTVALGEFLYVITLMFISASFTGLFLIENFFKSIKRQKSVITLLVILIYYI